MVQSLKARELAAAIRAAKKAIEEVERAHCGCTMKAGGSMEALKRSMKVVKEVEEKLNSHRSSELAIWHMGLLKLALAKALGLLCDDTKAADICADAVELLTRCDARGPLAVDLGMTQEALERHAPAANAKRHGD